MSNLDLRAGLLSKFRSELMGIATFGIFFVHSIGWIPWPGALRQLVSYGGVGVFVFAFLSGIGCYFSLKKNGNAVSFYIRRIQRVLIPYVLIAGIGYSLEYIYLHHDVLRAIQDYSFYSFFFNMGKGGLWYVGFCLLSYICAPVLFRVREKAGYVCVVELAIVVWIYFYKHEIYAAYHQTMTGFLIFSIGLFYGKAVKENRRHQHWIPMIVLIGFVIKILIPYKSGLVDDLFYSFLGIAGSFGFSVVLAIPMLQKANKLLLYLGSVSLEVYMINHFLQNVIPLAIPRTIVSYLGILLMGCLLSTLVQEITKQNFQIGKG